MKTRSVFAAFFILVFSHPLFAGPREEGFSHGVKVGLTELLLFSADVLESQANHQTPLSNRSSELQSAYVSRAVMASDQAQALGKTFNRIAPRVTHRGEFENAARIILLHLKMPDNVDHSTANLGYWHERLAERTHAMLSCAQKIRDLERHL